MWRQRGTLKSRDFVCIPEGEIKAKAVVFSLEKATHKAI